jgi:disulfide bond formation protein DsbB
MNTFFQHLNSPEYMHVLLNPVPVYGLAIGLVGLLLTIIARNRTAIVIALVLVFLSGLSAWPTYYYGEAAYDRVTAMADTVGDQWLDEHMARGEKLIYAFYVLAGLAIVGMFAPMKWPRSSSPLAIATLVIGCATLGIGGYIAFAGGHVRHREFRFEPPPESQSQEHHHHDEEHHDD